MKIGIFLGYGPQVKLGKEGLGRYIAGLLKGFQEQGHEITIACPNWLLKTLDDLFEDFSIAKDTVKFITTDSNPALWSFYLLLEQSKKKKADKSKLLSKIKLIIKVIGLSFANTENKVLFSVKLLLFMVLVLLCSIPVFFASLFLVPIYLLQKNKEKLTLIKNNLLAIMDLKTLFLSMFQRMNDKQLDLLVKRINLASLMDVWFVPALFWPQVNEIKNSVVVINAPDLVSQEFPQGFADVFNSDNAIEFCRQTIREGSYFITYCEYLRKQLLLNEYGKNANSVIAIPHVNNSMKRYIDIDPSMLKHMGVNIDLQLAFSKTLLNSLLGKSSIKAAYAFGMHFDDVSYIFYASQVRPSKNMLNLIKAYEILLRKKFIHHKLVLTANLKSNKLIHEYIKEHELENDIISFYNVSAQALAALYCCADLVVNPTLYEGGFPFTFGEGMSVGTPSVMSDIPQVRDVLEPAGLEQIMFDPYDYKAMAEKIYWALENKDALYKLELPLYEKLEKRSSALVAYEYEDAFKKFITLEKGL